MAKRHVNFTRPDELDEEQTIEENVEKCLLVGSVYRCDVLNVRAKPWSTSGIIGTIKKGSEIMIDEDDSTKDFYKICTASGIEGYCMKEFIELQK